MKLLYNYFLPVLVLGFVLSACTQSDAGEGKSGDEQTSEPQITEAVSTVYSTDGGVLGTVTFKLSGDSVRVQGEFSGLSEGIHGFHIHQYGDCRAEDESSAGGHYNPYNKNHGAPMDKDRHMGDMGNITVLQSGEASIDYMDPVIELNGPNSIIGRGVVIHAGQDDVSTQPSGDAGARIACGVIGVANPGEM